MADVPQIIIIYDPTGRYWPLLREDGRAAKLPLSPNLEPAAIAGIATQLGLLLLEQLAPPLKDE